MARAHGFSSWGVAILIALGTASAPVRAQNCCGPAPSQPPVSYLPPVSYPASVSYAPPASYPSQVVYLPPVPYPSHVSYLPPLSSPPPVSYAPQVNYRTVWRQVPVTTYRPVTYTNLLGAQTVYLQPVTALQWQAQQEAYTTSAPSPASVPVAPWQTQEPGHTTYRPIASNEPPASDARAVPQTVMGMSPENELKLLKKRVEKLEQVIQLWQTQPATR